MNKMCKMKYLKLGYTGLDVSRLCLGCMSFGNPKTYMHKWVLTEDEGRPIIKRALDLGINFFDTANTYSTGGSEEILGRAIKDFGNRDQIVIATKVWGEMREGPNGRGLSRKAIMIEIDKSLKRLGMDYIDLYIIHRWDYNTPIEETMETLHDLVKSGKTRYIGASAMYTWQFQKAQNVAKRNGWTPFVSMQNHWNLIYREEEREMIPFCNEEKIAITPYSPLASGRLTKDWSEKTIRSETDEVAKEKYDAMKQADSAIVERLTTVAKDRGVPRAVVALAWLLQKQQNVIPVIGATRMSNLEDAVSSLNFNLSGEEVTYLEELYVPHRISGFN